MAPGRLDRLMVPSAALLWGLQFAFLNPALALLLVSLFGASAGEVGLVLVIYNASGLWPRWPCPPMPIGRAIICGRCWAAAS